MKIFKNPWKSMKINEMIENYELCFWGRLPVSGTFAGEWVFGLKKLQLCYS